MPLIFQIKSVSKKYTQNTNTVNALEEINLSIEERDIYGIIGLSGAGKSTLIRSLARLAIPSSGKILFRNQDIAELKGQALRSYRKNIGMIFQHFNLLSSRTVMENIGYPLEINGLPKEKRIERVRELLELVGLQEKENAYPSQLSGGEKQRVGIARALANHPAVLLSDEATSSLDPKTTKEILELIKSINRNLGLTIVLITHEMDVIKRICNKVAVIEKGKIVEEGPVAKIFAEPNHPTTKSFLEGTIHELPAEFFHSLSANRMLLKLKFKGQPAGEPIISYLVRKYDVDANILLGWIDKLQAEIVGTLIVELKGDPQNIENALLYLKEKTVQCEVLTK